MRKDYIKANFTYKTATQVQRNLSGVTCVIINISYTKRDFVEVMGFSHQSSNVTK